MLEIRLKPNTTKMEYEKIYHGTGICHSDSFYKWLLRLLAPTPGKMFLDVACGEGRLTYWACQGGLQAHGVDFSLTAIHQAREKQRGHFMVGDGEALPYRSGIFDYITSIGSLEHYGDPRQGAREIARLLQPKGMALVLLPNTFGILNNVWTALRTGRPGIDNQPIQRYATAKEWEDLLQDAGLQVDKIFKYERECPTSAKDLGWYFRNPKNLVRLIVTPLVPVNWAGSFVFLCRK